MIVTFVTKLQQITRGYHTIPLKDRIVCEGKILLCCNSEALLFCPIVRDFRPVLGFFNLQTHCFPTGMDIALPNWQICFPLAEIDNPQTNVRCLITCYAFIDCLCNDPLRYPLTPKIFFLVQECPWNPEVFLGPHSPRAQPLVLNIILILKSSSSEIEIRHICFPIDSFFHNPRVLCRKKGTKTEDVGAKREMKGMLGTLDIR